MMNDLPITIENNALILIRSGMMERLDNPPATYEDWLEFGKKLIAAKQAIQWAIGDWIIYGETAYGEKYAQALDVTGLDYRTLQNYVWLSKSFEVSRRRDTLSWSHHEAVKGIADETEQDALLDIATKKQMGRDELRDVVKKYKNKDTTPSHSPLDYRKIEGRVVSDSAWSRALGGIEIKGGLIFIADTGEIARPGRATLYLYEDGE